MSQKSLPGLTFSVPSTLPIQIFLVFYLTVLSQNLSPEKLNPSLTALSNVFYPTYALYYLALFFIILITV